MISSDSTYLSIFYHKASVTVKETNNVALQIIVGISIENTVVADLHRTALRIVKKRRHFCPAV